MYDLFNYRLNDICLHRRCDLASFQSIRDFVTQFNKQVVDSRIATKQTILCTDCQNLTNFSINKEEKCDVLINNAGIMKCRKMHTQVCWCSHAWCIRIENVDQNLILFHHWCMFVTIYGLCMSLDGIDTTLPKLLLSPFAWSGRHRAPTWHQPHGALSSFSFA